MSCFKLITRQELGSTSSCKLRKNGFIPGIVKIIGNYILPIAVCENSVKKLTYKQKFQVDLNGVKMVLILKNYQIDNVSQKMQHLEYEQFDKVLTQVIIPVIFVKNEINNKINIKLDMPVWNIILIGSTSLIPNYIKVELTGFILNENIIFNNLSFNKMLITSNILNNVLSNLQ
ncbi:MAG: hypothetical protein ACKESC_01815 [Candidatus Hodgkinia cicadicola]